jgi:histidinol phosphatase-like PHP family hydrolase
MIDLHTHTLFSDGVLIPSELIRRFETLRYTAVAITDHADSSNLDYLVPRMVQVANDLNRCQSVKVIPGVEITHVPPSLIGPLVERARVLGAKLVVIHGETIVEPVAPGTNRAGLDARADIIAHHRRRCGLPRRRIYFSKFPLGKDTASATVTWPNWRGKPGLGSFSIQTATHPAIS